MCATATPRPLRYAVSFSRQAFAPAAHLFHMNVTKLAAICSSCSGLILMVYGIADLEENARVGLAGLLLVLVGASLTRKLLGAKRE